MKRRWRYSKTFDALWYCRIVYWLKIDAVIIQQQITDPFALRSISHKHWYDMTQIVDVWNTSGIELASYLLYTPVMLLSPACRFI
jgi:hypothetical protein